MNEKDAQDSVQKALDFIAKWSGIAVWEIEDFEAGRVDLEQYRRYCEEARELRSDPVANGVFEAWFKDNRDDSSVC
jgi:hypothetical protein